MILIDTNIWADHIAKPIPLMSELVETEEVCSHPHVIGELALGNLRQFDLVIRFLKNLRQVNSPRKTKSCTLSNLTDCPEQASAIPMPTCLHRFFWKRAGVYGRVTSVSVLWLNAWASHIRLDRRRREAADHGSGTWHSTMRRLHRSTYMLG